MNAQTPQTKPIISPLTKRILMQIIPKGWEEAAIYVSNGIGDAEPINRISFHENLETGNHIIMFHKQELKP